MDTEPTIFLASLAVIVLSLSYVFFHACQLAIRRARKPRIEGFVEGSWGRDTALLITSKPNIFILATQLGMLVSALLAGALGVDVVESRLFEPAVQRLLPGAGGATLAVLANVAAVSALTLVLLFVVQLVRSIVSVYPDRCLCLAAPVLALLGGVLRPILGVVDGSIQRVLRLVGVDASVLNEAVVSAEELGELAAASGEAGRIEEEQSEMIQSVVALSETPVRAVMTPRKDVIAVPLTASLDTLVQVIRQHRLSRLLVIGENLDDVRGLLLAKDLVQFVGQATVSFRMQPLIRPCAFVQAERRVAELLDEFRSKGVHFAVVQDEHGGVDGVVTIEDLVEEIVGDIYDEYDNPHQETPVREGRDGDHLIDGSLTVADLNSELHSEIPLGEYDTVAGYLMHVLGRIPHVGDSVTVAGLFIRVEEVQQNRVTKLRVRRSAAEVAPKSLEPRVSRTRRPRALKKYITTGAASTERGKGTLIES